ncbi:MAG TPA: hypothetical protein VFN21_02015 [Acidimicrobiales bacterium]|nr:hypothetical protein [Acidimicrobiales bacterium]
MRRSWWVVIVLASAAMSVVAFTVIARHQVGTPRPVGTVCDFEHDPGSGRSAFGRIEHRGWLVPHEACVHATDGENEQPVGFAPLIGALVTAIASAGLLMVVAWWRTRFRSQPGPVASRPNP